MHAWVPPSHPPFLSGNSTCKRRARNSTWETSSKTNWLEGPQWIKDLAPRRLARYRCDALTRCEGFTLRRRACHPLMWRSLASGWLGFIFSLDLDSSLPSCSRWRVSTTTAPKVMDVNVLLPHDMVKRWMPQLVISVWRCNRAEALTPAAVCKLIWGQHVMATKREGTREKV